MVEVMVVVERAEVARVEVSMAALKVDAMEEARVVETGSAEEVMVLVVVEGAAEATEEVEEAAEVVAVKAEEAKEALEAPPASHVCVRQHGCSGAGTGSSFQPGAGN
jgi:hypothetical protein